MSTLDITSVEELVASIREKIGDAQKDMKTCKPKEKEGLQKRITELVGEADTVLARYNNELKSLGPSDKKIFKQRYNAHYEAIAALKTEIGWKAAKDDAKSDREKLVSGAGGSGSRKSSPSRGASPSRNGGAGAGAGAGELTAHGRAVLGDSKSSLQSSLKVVQDSLAVARGTAGTLDEQTDQMRAINDKNDQITSNLNRAEKTAKIIRRNV